MRDLKLPEGLKIPSSPVTQGIDDDESAKKKNRITVERDKIDWLRKMFVECVLCRLSSVHSACLDTLNILQLIFHWHPIDFHKQDDFPSKLSQLTETMTEKHRIWIESDGPSPFDIGRFDFISPFQTLSIQAHSLSTLTLSFRPRNDIDFLFFRLGWCFLCLLSVECVRVRL